MKVIVVFRNFAKAFKNFIRKLWSYHFRLMKLKKNNVICAFTSLNNPLWCWWCQIACFRNTRGPKYNWTSTDGKTHNQIDHILIDRRRHSSILDVRSFRGANCDTDHCLMVAKLRERLAVRKQAARKFEGERFNLGKLKELEVKEKYQIEITNRFAALEKDYK